MRCINCEELIPDGEVRWGFDEPYCEECFDENYNYCCHCDTLISSDLTNYSSDGDAYCNECWEQDYDDDAPDNPNVSEEDQNLIIQLSRNWLQGKVDYRKPISINEKDLHLKTIKRRVGFVEQPSIYMDY